MAQLDDIGGPVMDNGRDINVIAQKVPVKTNIGSKIFEILLWFCVIPGIVVLCCAKGNQTTLIVGVVLAILGLLPGLIYIFSKIKAGNYLLQLEQKIQHSASQVDNYLEQRVVILKNTSVLVEKAVNVDKETFKDIAAMRTTGRFSDEDRNDVVRVMDQAQRNINLVLENYPNLRSHESIQKAMEENSYLQKEITAAREVYNDSVLRWNTEIFVWPCKKIVAASRGYTTRIPFAASQAVKEEARSVFFKA